MNDLVFSPRPDEAAGLLDDWRWLIPFHCELIAVTALGDAFVRAADGSVHWLDTGAAELTRVAPNPQAFRLLLEDPVCAEPWLIPDLVSALRTSGRLLNAGQCYSFKIPPTLGGAYEPANYDVLEWLSHFRSMAMIQSQVRDLPIGTVINHVKLEGR